METHHGRDGYHTSNCQAKKTIPAQPSPPNSTAAGVSGVRNPQRIVNAMVALGGLSLNFGRVDRITYHQDGLTPESDTDHTVMLGLIACALADQHFPDLNVGLIAQYALVHDLVEVYAGDTPTLRVPTADAKAEKQQREHEAYQRISREFGTTLPWLHILIGRYEARTSPEARFVKALDKLLPKITHILNGAATIHEQGMTPDELATRYETQIGELEAYAADFPELFELRAVLVDRVLAQLAESPACTCPLGPEDAHFSDCPAGDA